MKKTFGVQILSPWVFAVLAFSVSANADVVRDDGAFVDPPYRNLRHPRVEATPMEVLMDLLSERRKAPRSSETAQLSRKITPARSQGSRGTCSIFSATGMLEAMLILKKDATPAIDLSEEWLEYLIMRESGSEGSSSDNNFDAIGLNGMPSEEFLPYIGETWEKLSDSPLAEERCGKATHRDLETCLLGHRKSELLNLTPAVLNNSASEHYDPEFAVARVEALKMKKKVLRKYGRSVGNGQSWVASASEAKKLLAQGIPVTLDIDFYYGAWNHRKAEEYGLGRDMDQWGNGVVGYPEVGSLDRKVALEHPAGHSVLLVGYDDDVEVTTEVKMANGSTKKFTYKGVYYFKNSWGTESFGASFEVGGEKFPGFGTITQKYAHEQGAFFQMQLE